MYICAKEKKSNPSGKHSEIAANTTHFLKCTKHA